LALVLIGFAGRRRKHLTAPFLFLALFAIIPMLIAGCGGSSKSGITPATPSSTTLVLDTAQPKAASGTAVTFTTTIAGVNGVPTGTVTFSDGSIAIGTATTFTNGQATISVSNLGIGTHSISAKYSGDSLHDASTSNAVYQAITGTTPLDITATSGTLIHTVDLNLTIQ
jgi:hypothetical protein